MAELDPLAFLEQVLDERTSFLMEAGAGSGKTFALVHALRHLLHTQRAELARSGRAIACITYTNVAKEEIARRISQDPLVHVSTIHKFLWSVVQGFQHQLREELIAYNRELRRPYEGVDDLEEAARITYSDRGRRFAEGAISHDEVIELSFRLFAKYPKLARVTVDRYPVIFVDEYQDTFPETIDLLLNHLLGSREGRPLIGLSGDSMQKIYNKGVGPVRNDKLVTLTKHENFRCSPPVIDLLNKIRPELQQYPAGRQQGGEVLLLLHAAAEPGAVRLQRAIQTLAGRGWPLEETKQLILTHRMIAETHGYAQLERLYDSRGRNGRSDLMEGTEPYAQTLAIIESLCLAYERKDYGPVMGALGAGGMVVTSHANKVTIARGLRQLAELRQSGTIGEVLDTANTLRLVPTPRKIHAVEQLFATPDLDEPDQRRVDFATKLRDIPFLEWIAFSQFRDEQTPFSTQHGVKGTEFENVIVVIDDTAWNQYNMGRMITGEDIPQRLERSRNMFYVCCSRARQRLAVVFLSDLSPEALTISEQWFGLDNIVP